MHFEVYRQSGEVYFHLGITSKDETHYDVESFYKKMLTHAIETSELKGSVFSMSRNELDWQKISIQKRDFNDIFLPQTNIEDLNLYIQVGTELDVMMRYLMVGNPGTGKTEATTVLANILNQKGVTVIKTVVCDKIKEKVDLATLLAPSIIILDDIDLSIGSRGKSVHAERLQDFLDVLDGAEKLSKNVGIIATTNSTALLDMAAQRPGRFDKIILFNELTRDNIKNIILKSFADNFKIKSKSNKVVNIMTDKEVINTLFTKNVSGAYVYSTTKMIKLKIDMLKLESSIDVAWVVKEIENNLQTMSKLRNMDFLSDKISNSSSNIGFETEQSESEYYEEDDDRDFYLAPDDLEENYPGLDSEDIEHLKRRIKTSPKRR
jgi:SpoVK/Ycf46/Vps4 family AAA+-type ATPase